MTKPARKFVIADTHFGHAKMVEPQRPFKSVFEHDSYLVNQWNKTVRPDDFVYLLGNVCMNRSALEVCRHLTGRKILIKGNHDLFRAEEYLQFFEDIQGALPYQGVILTHIPVHPSQLNRWSGNIHGHLHEVKIDDPRYLCVSAEQVGYTPMLLLDAIQHIRPGTEMHIS